jgi:hypothetical protein
MSHDLCFDMVASSRPETPRRWPQAPNPHATTMQALSRGENHSAPRTSGYSACYPNLVYPRRYSLPPPDLTPEEIQANPYIQFFHERGYLPPPPTPWLFAHQKLPHISEQGQNHSSQKRRHVQKRRVLDKIRQRVPPSLLIDQIQKSNGDEEEGSVRATIEYLQSLVLETSQLQDEVQYLASEVKKAS